MPDQNGMILAPNLAQDLDAVAAVQGPVAVASMPASRMTDPEPSVRCRLSSRDPLYSHTYLDLGREVDGVACATLVGVELSAGAKVRVVASPSSTTIPFWTREPPTAIVTSANASGVVGDIDEDPRTPDGSWMTPTVFSSSWHIQTGFGTPSSSPVTGAHKQTFGAWVRMAGSLGAADVTPLISVDLYESGSIVASLATRQVSSVAGQWIIATWDAVDLAVASGAGVEMRLTMTYSSGGQYVEVGAVGWYVETAASMPSNAIRDTGWTDYPHGDDRLGGPPGVVVHIPDVPIDGVQHIFWMLRDDGVRLSRPTRIAAVPSVYIDIGVMVTSPVLHHPELNFDGAEISGDLPDRSYTLGGQTVGGRVPIARRWRLTWSYDERADAMRVYDAIYRLSTQPFLIVMYPDTDSADEARHTTAWVEAVSLPRVGVPRDAVNRRALELEVREKL